jgi:asparagine synthase (glutamine-hydrolysing)
MLEKYFSMRLVYIITESPFFFWGGGGSFVLWSHILIAVSFQQQKICFQSNVPKMCGIHCTCGHDNASAESELKETLADAKLLTHRGPDASGYVADESSVFAHCRLEMVDAASGKQPLETKDKRVVTSVNGEIYNHRRKRKQLERVHYSMTKSDCEIILHLFLERPHSFVNELRGMFAFALKDKVTNTVVFARDHIGMLPLYWGSKSNSYTTDTKDMKGAKDGKDAACDKRSDVTEWDSETLRKRSLIPCASASKKMVSSDMRTLQDPRKVDVLEHFPPGHYWIGDSTTGRGELREWYLPAWKACANYMPPMRSVEECVENLRYRLKKATVKHYYMRDPGIKAMVPLSGGLDSSIVVAILALDAVERGMARIETCCCGLVDKGGNVLGSDILEARKVAAMWNTDHTEYLYTIEEALAVRREVIRALETCYTTSVRASLCMFLMCRDLQKKGFKMFVTGSGSDELFGGYLYFHRCPSPEEMQKELTRKGDWSLSNG